MEALAYHLEDLRVPPVVRVPYRLGTRVKDKSEVSRSQTRNFSFPCYLK